MTASADLQSEPSKEQKTILMRADKQRGDASETHRFGEQDLPLPIELVTILSERWSSKKL
jgi:hypothetical protein